MGAGGLSSLHANPHPDLKEEHRQAMNSASCLGYKRPKADTTGYAAWVNK